MTISEINQRLAELSGNNTQFYVKSIPGAKPIHGVRLPELKKLAAKIAADDHKSFLAENPSDTYELQILQAFVIGFAKDETENSLRYFEDFIPFVNDWSVSDTLCQAFRPAKKHPAETFAMLMKYKDSAEEFRVRIVAVMMLCHFLTDEYIDKAIAVIDSLDTRSFYASMGTAWAVSVMMAKHPEKCEKYMLSPDNHLDDRTYNKAIQKMKESYRVSDEMKLRMNKLKR